MATALAEETDGNRSGTTVSTQSQDGRWEGIFNEDTRYYTWHSTRGFAAGPTIPSCINIGILGCGLVVPPGLAAAGPLGSGSLLYAPFAFQVTGRPNDDFKSEFLLRGGYVDAAQTTPGMSGLVSTSTDTSITEKITYYGFAGIRPYASVSFNIPTGKTVLFGSSAFARMDSDLVEIATFGEGFNVGPTIGVNIPLTPNLITAFGLGYTNRGAYDREGSVDPVTLVQGLSHLAPGSVSTANTTLGYRNGGFTLQASGSVSTETMTYADGAPITKAGNRYLASLTLSNAWTNYLTSSVTGTYTHSLRNKVIDPDLGDLVVEAFNSNSDVFKAVFDLTTQQGAWSFGPTGSYLYRNNNSWSSTAMEFLPAKTRFSAGGTTAYAVNNAISFNARVERIWIKEQDNPDKFLAVTGCSALGCPSPDFGFIVPGSGVPTIWSTGWLFSLAATAHF